MHVLRVDLFDESSIHSAEIGFQYNIAVLHLDFQIVMSFKPNFRCDTFRDSNRQTLLLRHRFLAPSSSVDMQETLGWTVDCVKVLKQVLQWMGCERTVGWQVMVQVICGAVTVDSNSWLDHPVENWPRIWDPWDVVF